MVHPNTPLADLEAIHAWAMSHQRSLYADAWAGDATARSSITARMDTARVDTLLTYREDTGRGISEEALRTLGFPPGERDVLRSNVVTTEFDAQIGLGELADLSRHVLSNDSPAMLNKLMPKALRIAERYGILLPTHFIVNWRDMLDKLERLGDVALDLAGDAQPCNLPEVPAFSSEEAFRHGRDVLAQWGRAAIEAAHYSRADLMLALGLEDLVDDALVRARDLARR